MPSLWPWVAAAQHGAWPGGSARPEGRIRRVDHPATPGRLEVRTEPDQQLISGGAHQSDELGPVLLVDGKAAMVGLGVGRAIPVEIVAARTPAVATVLADTHLGVRRVIGAGDGPELS